MSDPFDTGNLLDVYQAGANPDNLGRGPALMSVIWTLTAISIIVIGAHLLNRKYSDALHWDDAFMFAALVGEYSNE
jgi:hypothetical protein